MRYPEENTNGPSNANSQPLTRKLAPVPPPPANLPSFSLRVTVAVLITVGIVLLVYILWQGMDILLEVFAGVLFALFLQALSERLQKWTGLSYSWSLGIVVVALFAIAAVLGWMMERRLSIEMVQLAERLPESMKQIEKYLSETPAGQWLLDKVPQAADSLSSPGLLGRMTGVLTGIANALLGLLVIFFVGIFGAAEPALYRAGVLHLFPYGRRQRVAQALDAVAFNLRWWLVGQVFLMVAVAVTTAIGLWLIGVPLALVLGLIAGIFEAVPYLGPWISAVPAGLIALLVGPLHLVMTLALFLVIHLLEGYVMVPLVQRRAVRLPPALTLAAQILLAKVFGILGMMVAAPLTVAFVVVLKMLYVEDTLGDKRVEVPGEKPNAKDATAELSKPAG